MSVTDAERLDVKIFVDAGKDVDVKKFMAIFQRWIREKLLPEMLIDVADYTHVTDGPGMVLVGHEGQYVLDSAEGRLGLLYSHRRDVKGTFEARIAEVFRRALRACVLIESEPTLSGAVRFASGDVLFRINDRLRAPITAATLDAVRPALDAVLAKLYAGSQAALEPRPASGDEPFSVAIRATKPPGVAELLKRLGA